MKPKKSYLALSLADFLGMVAEMQDRSDRTAALVGAAVLDALLSQVIETRFVALSKHDAKKLYNGPLGSFSSKINLGHALGLYEKPLARIST